MAAESTRLPGNLNLTHTSPNPTNKIKLKFSRNVELAEPAGKSDHGASEPGRLSDSTVECDKPMGVQIEHHLSQLATLQAHLDKASALLATPMSSAKRPRSGHQTSSSAKSAHTETLHKDTNSAPRSTKPRYMLREYIQLPELSAASGDATCCRQITFASDCGYARVSPEVNDLAIRLSTGYLYKCECCQAQFAKFVEDTLDTAEHFIRALQTGAPKLSFGYTNGQDEALMSAIVGSWCVSNSDSKSLEAQICSRVAEGMPRRTVTTFTTTEDEEELVYVLVLPEVECLKQAHKLVTSAPPSSSLSRRSGLHIVFVDVRKLIIMPDPVEEVFEEIMNVKVAKDAKASLTTPVRKTARTTTSIHSADVPEIFCLIHLLRIGYVAPTLVELTEDRGRAVFAGAFIPRGAFVVEYKGQLVSGVEAEERESLYREKEYGSYLFFFQHNGLRHCVDATAERPEYGVGRLINHSRKQPNLSPRVIVVDGVPRLALFARKDIHYSVELLYDYGEMDKDALKALSWMQNT